MHKLLDLFSGTHSVGKIASQMGYEVTSLDRDLDAKSKLYDYTSNNHIKGDIMTWEYKKYPKKYFDVVTASPVCLYWSRLRNCWINRKMKGMNRLFTKEDIINDIDNIAKPMIDKVIEIIEYFEPSYYWIENPQTGKLKYYMEEKHKKYNIFYDFDYCKYSDFGYKKRTRFWTNIKNINNQLCKNDCKHIMEINNGDIVQKIHNVRLGSMQMIRDENNRLIYINTKAKREKYKDYEKIKKNSKVPTRWERYRVPEKIIIELLNNCQA